MTSNEFPVLRLCKTLAEIFMELQHFNSDLKIQQNAFAWRYMSFAKISDLLCNSSMYFSRLDTFHDPIEGLPIKYRSNLQIRHLVKYALSNDEFDEKDSKISNVTQEHIDSWQKGTYCSCWYLTEDSSDKNSSDRHHESLAMWNFLDEQDGFVFKIHLDSLIKLLSTSLVAFQDKQVFAAKYGKVHYLNYQEYVNMFNTGEQQLMPSLIKHNSYRFENEIRFLLLRKKPLNESIDRTGVKIQFKEKFDLDRHQIEIIAHPRLGEKKYKDYRAKFQDIDSILRYPVF